MDFDLYKGARLSLVGGMLFSLGCHNQETGTKEAADPCADPIQLAIENPEALAGEPDFLAQLTLDELSEIDENNKPTTNGVISAVFADVSAYTEDLTPAAVFDASCVGILGAPETASGITPMSADSVSIESPFLGAHTMALDETGRFAPLIMDEVFSQAGGETIAIRVSSDGGVDHFPGFETTMSAPPAIQGREAVFQPDGTLRVSWTPAWSTYFEIVIKTEQESADLPDNRVRCFLLADDGCYHIPSNALTWVRAQGAETLHVRMERHVLKLAVPEKKALAEIDAMRSIEYTIDVI